MPESITSQTSTPWNKGKLAGQQPPLKPNIGLNPSDYGTHSLRRTKVAQIYRETGNLRAVQLLLGHTKIESTVRYLGIDADDALQLAERVEL